MSDMQILLASPRGFCAGVDRAIDIVERAIELFGAPIYVRHEVVHNKHVVDRLRALGARFIEDLDEVPAGASLIFSAHGVSSAVDEEARARGFEVFDATCPLVTKVHLEVARYARDARDVVLIGHAGHPEVEGTMGRFDASHGGQIHLVEDVVGAMQLQVRRPESLAFVTQTTLSWMTPRRLSMRCAAASRSCWRHASRTSATPRRTGRTRSSGCCSNAMCWWWWVQSPARIPTACASLPTAREFRVISWTVRTTCNAIGLRGVVLSA